MFMEFINSRTGKPMLINTDQIASVDPHDYDTNSTTIQIVTRGQVEVTVPYTGVVDMIEQALKKQWVRRGSKGVDRMVDLEAEFDNQGRAENLS